MIRVNNNSNNNYIIDGWKCWDNIRYLTNHDNKLFVALEIPENNIEMIKLWAAEPVKAILLPMRLFIENKNGYPVLSRQHQELLMLLWRQ